MCMCIQSPLTPVRSLSPTRTIPTMLSYTTSGNTVISSRSIDSATCLRWGDIDLPSEGLARRSRYSASYERVQVIESKIVTGSTISADEVSKSLHIASKHVSASHDRDHETGSRSDQEKSHGHIHAKAKLPAGSPGIDHDHGHEAPNYVLK
jgi:hypothetical protein